MPEEGFICSFLSVNSVFQIQDSRHMVVFQLFPYLKDCLKLGALVSLGRIAVTRRFELLPIQSVPLTVFMARPFIISLVMSQCLF